MKLTGKLKEQVKQTSTMENAKIVIEEAGMELTDDEMDQVAGGLKKRLEPRKHKEYHFS